MSNRNGHSKTAPWYKRLLMRGAVRESAGQSEILDAISELTSLMMRRSGDLLTFGGGQTTQQYRREGRNFPFFDNEQQLANLRAASRIMCGSGTYGAGLIEGFASYVLGTGLTYTIEPRQGIDDTTGVPVAAAAQAVIDHHLRRNQWLGGEQPGIEIEFFRRSVRDGEAILVHFPNDDGTTDERFAEPDMLRQKPNTDFATHGFGIETPKGDSSRPLCYWITWDYIAAHGEEYEPDYVTHFRRNVDRNIKRGLPDFSFDAHSGLNAANKLRDALGETAAEQASIASVMQYENASPDQVQSLVDSTTDYQVADAITGLLDNIRRFKKGLNLHVSKGQQYIEGPGAQNAPNHLMILDMLLRSASRPWNAPDWLASGDASGSTFANALHEESPWLRRVLREQICYCEALKTAPWFALRHWCETKGLRVGGVTLSWSEVVNLVELKVTAPSPEVRDKLQEAQRDQVYVGIGAKSVQQVCQEQGFDPQKVQDERDQWREANPDAAGQGLSVPMGFGQPGGTPAMESWLRECGGEGGKPGPCPDHKAEPAKAEPPVKTKPTPPKDPAAQELIDKWTGEGGGADDYAEVKAAGEKWASGEKNPTLDAVYQDTQQKLKAAGINEIQSYRGVRLPEDHPLVADIRSGKVKLGDSIEISGGAFASWSRDPDVGANFAKKSAASLKGNQGAVGIVLERSVKAEDVVSGHGIHPGYIDGEKEVLAKANGPLKLILKAVY